MAFVEDLSPFLADFGETVTLAGVAVVAIFDQEAVVHGDGPLAMVSSQPMLTIPQASCPANPVGQTAVVRGLSYTIVDARPDGTGMATLMLERQA